MPRTGTLAASPRPLGNPKPTPTSTHAKPATSPIRKLSPTEQLIADVTAAGGELHIDRSSDKTNYHLRVASAIRFNKVPDGKLLTLRQGRRWEDLVVRLEDPPAWMNAELAPISVPPKLRAPHKVVADLAQDHEKLKLAAPVRNRALRLLHALATEAVGRGYRVQGAKNAARGYEQTDHTGGLVAISVNGHIIGLDVAQQHDRIPHQPTAAEHRRAERDSWFRIATHDRVPTSRLEIGVLGGREYRKSRWADGTVPLDDQLAQILQEVELRAAFKEEQRLAAERELAERQRQWEEATAAAVKRLRSAHRAEILMRQVDDWARAAQLDAFLDAMEAAIDRMADAEDEAAAREWLNWARRYRRQIDPLNHPLAMPADPKPSAENLKPYLGGWSFYGPQRHYGP